MSIRNQIPGDTWPAFILAAVASVMFSACGVRGRPQPPLTPAELGRGKPTFTRATEEFRFKDVPSPQASPDASPEASPIPHVRPSNPNLNQTKPTGDTY